MGVMNHSKPYERPEDFCVFVSFRPADSSTLNTASENLDEIMKKKFGDAQRREFLSEEPLEIVYRLQKPIIADNSAMKEFFEDLRSLFISTSHLQPYFTQFEGQ
jgi:hypothetical protein